jgi:hypothetical protein
MVVAGLVARLRLRAGGILIFWVLSSNIFWAKQFEQLCWLIWVWHVYKYLSGS